MKLYKKIILGIGIVVIATPTLAMSGSLMGSLIEGKTPAEAVQILADQIDLVLPRIETIEVKQAQQDEVLNKTQEAVELENEKVNLLEDVIAEQEAEKQEQQRQINILQQTIEERIIEDREEKEKETAIQEAFNLMEAKCAEYGELYIATPPNIDSIADDYPLDTIRNYVDFLQNEMDNYAYPTSTDVYYGVQNKLALIYKNLPQLEVLQTECHSLREQYNNLK